jgi:phosphate starvation-inducible membrane PsiE
MVKECITRLIVTKTRKSNIRFNLIAKKYATLTIAEDSIYWYMFFKFYVMCMRDFKHKSHVRVAMAYF